MKSIYSVLVLTLLTLCLNAQSLDIPLVTVTETETTYAPVDEIHFSLVIKTHSQDIAEARNKNRDISQEVFKYLDKKKIPKRYIQTKRMHVSRNYIRRGGQSEYDGFNAFQEIYVCLTEMELFDEILDALLQMDIESVNGPNFKSSVYEETMKAARLKALTKAKDTATDMAEALGQKIGKAKLIDTQVASSYNKSAYASAENRSADTGSTSFEVGELEIKAVVNVSFELLE